MVMSPRLSPELTEEVLKQRSGHTEILLVTVHHEDWDDDIRMASLNPDILYIDEKTHRPIRGVRSRGKDYVYTGIMASIPSSADNAPPETQFTFGNVTREHVAMLKTVDLTYPTVTLELTSTINPNYIEITYAKMEIYKADWKNDEATVTLRVKMAARESAPFRKFTKSSHPNLYGV